MARRERERYTERARKGRQAAGRSESGDIVISAKNPAVVVAIGGLVLAAFMLVGFLIGREPGTETADAPDAVEEVAEEAAAEEGAAEEAPPVEPPAEEPSAPEDPAPAAADNSSRNGMYSQWEGQNLDAEANAYFATITTNRGTIELELFPDVAPQHVDSFAFLTREGFFDGLTFHRVEPGFVIQGGDPLGQGMGGPGYNVPAEFNADNPVPHRRGTLAMARSGDPNSAGSQFYIVLQDGPSASSLDGKYTVFGHTISGLDAVDATQIGDVIESIVITEKPKAESVVNADDIRAGNLPAEQ